MLEIQAIPAFKDNYIWLLSNAKTHECWVVDPGEAQPVLDLLSKQNKSLNGILITHHHHDHTDGIEGLINYFGKIPIYASHKSANPFVTNRLRDGDAINCSDNTFKILEIPGHTFDHIAYVSQSKLFSGDTLFSAGCGRVFEGTPEQMLNSLNKLAALPPSTELYCGHEYTAANLKFAATVEPENVFIQEKLQQITKRRTDGQCSLPSLLRDEKKMNPFLRCDNPELITALETHVEQKFSNPLAVFSYLREWKNNF